jgi:hypothetical protein
MKGRIPAEEVNLNPKTHDDPLGGDLSFWKLSHGRRISSTITKCLEFGVPRVPKVPCVPIRLMMAAVLIRKMRQHCETFFNARHSRHSELQALLPPHSRTAKFVL